VLTAHCVKNGFFKPIVKNLFFYKGNKNFRKLVEIEINRIMFSGGVLHLWGHSWEIEQNGLWPELEIVFKLLAFNKNISYLNNTECWKVITSNKISKFD
jgi:hypothetical protein